MDDLTSELFVATSCAVHDITVQRLNFYKKSSNHRQAHGMPNNSFKAKHNIPIL